MRVGHGLRAVAVSAAVIAGCASADARPSAVASAGRDADLPDVVFRPLPRPDAPQPEDASIGEAPPLDASERAFPSGPYGYEVGQTLADARFEGYVNAEGRGLSTAQPFRGTSMRELRGEARGYALVVVAEFYCGGCQASARDLAERSRAILDAGGTVVMVLSSQAYTARPTREALDAWVRTYGLEVTAVIDAPEEPFPASQSRYGGYDSALVVDLGSMRVVARERLFASTGSAVRRAATTMMRLLRGG